MTQPFTFRFAERCLYEYPENCARILHLREELRRLSSLSVQNYDAKGHSGKHADPVGQYFQRATDLEERIAALEARTEPITRLREKLGNGPNILRTLRRILDCRYLWRMTWAEIAEGVGLPERTMYRRRGLIVRWACKFLGERV